MDQNRSDVWKRIGTFLFFTATISSVFWFFMISTGRIGAGRGLYVVGLMWSPGIAGLLTRYIYQGNLAGHGWKWGKTKYQWTSYLLPLGYGGVVYVLVWLTGLGGFFNRELVAAIAGDAGWEGLPGLVQLLLYFLFLGTLGMARGSSTALGEELGWRGFLVPELDKVMSFTKVSLLSGLIWAVWHYPILLFADYNSGTPLWYALICFTIMAVGISFAFAWLRIKSGSLWTAMLLHASHNLFIQSIFDPITVDTGVTKYVIGEFGCGLALSSIVVALLFWRRRGELNPT